MLDAMQSYTYAQIMTHIMGTLQAPEEKARGITIATAHGEHFFLQAAACPSIRLQRACKLPLRFSHVVMVGIGTE